LKLGKGFGDSSHDSHHVVVQLHRRKSPVGRTTMKDQRAAGTAATVEDRKSTLGWSGVRQDRGRVGCCRRSFGGG
jgi:hypothetical protein